MIKTAKKYSPNEIGGIFLGEYKHDKNIEQAVIDEISIPLEIVSTPTMFIRSANILNSIISDRFYSSNGNIFYIGEWHSHPSGDPQFSKLDFDSMKAIAINTNIHIKHPVLCIIYPDKIKWKFIFYIYYEGELYEYDKDKD